LNCELEFKSVVGPKQKISDQPIVSLILTAEFRSIDIENYLFKEILKLLRLKDFVLDKIEKIQQYNLTVSQ